MSVVDQFKKLFSKNDAPSEHDSRLSLAMPEAAPDGTVGMLVTTNRSRRTWIRMRSSPWWRRSSRTRHPRWRRQRRRLTLIELPVLGRKTVSQHQRTLMILLGVLPLRAWAP
jgi:twitching motility protein PilJ